MCFSIKNILAELLMYHCLKDAGLKKIGNTWTLSCHKGTTSVIVVKEMIFKKNQFCLFMNAETIDKKIRRSSRKITLLLRDWFGSFEAAGLGGWGSYCKGCPSVLCIPTIFFCFFIYIWEKGNTRIFILWLKTQLINCLPQP